MGKYKGFTSVELRKPKRSMFDLSHEKRLTGIMGRLIPIFISETLPNDTFKVKSEVMVRFAPMLAPVMHRVNVFVHYFFIPNRILWKDWETFITGGRLGAAVDTPPVPPFIDAGVVLDDHPSAFGKSDLWDYFDNKLLEGETPTSNWTGVQINVLPFLAYQACYRDYYRDRNFDTFLEGNTPANSLPAPSGDITNWIPTGTDYLGVLTIKQRNWQHDYFTSAQSSTQRGSEVLMPLQGSGNVTYFPQSSVINTVSGVGPGAQDLQSNSALNTNLITVSAGAARIENISGVELTSSDVSINDLRRAVRLQEWLERNQLAGSRYNESIMAHFGRKTSDSRLQRAEYLGGGKVPVQISEVMTTAYSDDGTDVVPPANMAGRGISFGKSNYFKYNCEEHGFVIGIMSVMPTTSYMQGIRRMFLQRWSFFDYPWPSFAHLGEQEVYKYEVFGSHTNARKSGAPLDTPIFGYQSRYADWKSIESSTHGDFRESLDFWHLTRKFATSPVLGAVFNRMEATLPDRIFAVSGVDHLWVYLFNDVKVVRALPYFGTPML